MDGPTPVPDTEFDPERVVVRDKRRLDPDSGELREPAPATAPEATVEEQVEESTDVLAAELTADLQRVTAEYANYRKRVDRDRLAVVETAVGTLLSELLPLLDDVDRARQHDDLTGAFKGVGEALEAVTAKLGLERFGAPGEPFDPAVHEALMQAEPDPTSTVATCAAVLQPGYRVGGRVLRPARVSVAEPGAADLSDPSDQQ
ncbi:MAG: nucleotide exchange factor GrpE [Mycobacteriales bacterium]|nr:nucleotide exchange factor GrpE [Mycobacteriales bacterium]